MGLQFDPGTRIVQDVLNLYEKRQLNLAPPFQRESVWTPADRQKLIESILRGYPLPSIFLYRHEKDGSVGFDVIDGKQRLETILMFTGLIRGHRFSAKCHLPGDEEPTRIDWNGLKRRKLQHQLEGYRLQTVEVRGDLSDVIDLFVRINSTGKALSAAEKRKAKYYNDPLLREARRLAGRYEEYFKKQRILSAGQILRLKDIELLCELMISIHQGDVINKKSALDRVMGGKSLGAGQIQKASRRTVTALNRVRRLFPNLLHTRFFKLSDFYSLVVLVAKFEAEGLILTDSRRNRLAWDLLKTFSTGVDSVRDKQKRAEGSGPGQELYREYLLTVLEGTDEISKRQKREALLRGLLGSLFEKTDGKRLFSSEQRRILFNSAAEPRCEACGKKLGWEDFTADHIHPFSKGGRTALANAALLCRRHNSAKGNRATPVSRRR